MKEGAVIVQRITWQDDVEEWSRPWEFDEWCKAVCQGKNVNLVLLQKYYAAHWEPASCHAYVVKNKLGIDPNKRFKSRIVTLDELAVNRRFALCLWRECGKLLSRRMTPPSTIFMGASGTPSSQMVRAM